MGNQMMSCEIASLVPRKRIDVFISSAQSQEKDIDWGKNRKAIRDVLRKCPYLNPFIIEDAPSEFPSTQKFTSEVKNADIIVMMVKSELRKGTHREFFTAQKYSKPVLLYFIKDEAPESDVIEFKAKVEEEDYCTYRNVETFDEILDRVGDDVITNVIYHYQYIHDKDESEGEEVRKVTANDDSLGKLGVPTKSAINLFSSSYPYILDYFGITHSLETQDNQSEFHDLGLNILKWLLTGKEIRCDNKILELIKKQGELYGDTEWLNDRWDAIRFELEGDPEKALQAEKEALRLARKANLPKWIIDDILIDCRNIDIELFHQKKEHAYNDEFQQEITGSNTIIYLPVLDRYYSNIYREIEKEEIKYTLASPNTFFYGTNIGSVINDVENYMFSAVLYGSYTHMMMTRQILARVLYKYYEFTEDPSLLLSCIKLLVIHGDVKQFTRTVRRRWDDAYEEIVANADEIWSLTDFAVPIRKAHIKEAVIAELGMYLSDLKFCEAQSFLEEFAFEISCSTSEEFFDCINRNILRLDDKKVVQMLIGIINDERFLLGGKLSYIIMQLKIRELDTKSQTYFRDVMKKKIPLIVKNGGSPQLIAHLEKENPDVFSVLSTIPENGLEGIERTFYYLNMGKEEWDEALKYEIKTARTQFQANEETGAYIEFAEQPYTTIKKIIREHYMSSMNEAIINEFFPLCIDVMNSETVPKVKDDCISCLCDILVFAPMTHHHIPPELISAIDSMEIPKKNTIFGIPDVLYACRTQIVRIICGIYKNDEILELSIGYNKRDELERAAIAECIEQFIRRNLEDGQEIYPILPIVMQCFDDEYYVARRRACDCMMLLLNTKYREVVERKLFEASLDPSHFVRSHVLDLCRDGKIEDYKICEAILSNLENDANYAIRTRCDKLTSSY